MFAVCAIALLCLTSVSHSAPLDCKDVVEPWGHVDLQRLEGRWVLVADSLKIIEAPQPFRPIDSITIDFHNSTYTQANRYGDVCHYDSRNVSIEGPTFSFKTEYFRFNGTIIKTTCQDCVILSLAFEGPNYRSEELCLFSKRREVDDKELDEFKAQAECLKMPKPLVMDPSKELCAQRSTA